MGRDDANKVWTTYESGNEPNQLMNTEDIGLSWRGGGEIRFGRSFCCGAWALEATYWTLESFDGFVSQSHASGVSTPLNIGWIEFAPGDPLLDYFDNAAEHRLWRNNEIHSVEVDLVRKRMFGGYEVPFGVDCSLGIRYFRFDEDLLFGSLAAGGTWGANGGQDEAYISDRITNSLLGFQIGFHADYRLWRNLYIFATPEFGIYNNEIVNDFRLYRGDGTVAQIDPASGMIESYPVHSTKDVVSFLTQIDLGLEWRFAERWSAEVGYRVVAVTGVGLADNQIPPYIIDVPEIRDIDYNGDLVVHGGFAGLTYRF